MLTSNTSAAVINIERREKESADRREIELNHRNSSAMPLSAYVKQAIDLYFVHHKDADIENLYSMVISAVEKPLLESTLAHTGHNQTKAAKALGLSRSTLRKKLEQYGLS